MKSLVKLFVSRTCPNCPAAKKEIEELKSQRDDFELQIFETTTPEGIKEAQIEEIRSVPTYIIKGDGYPNKIGLVGSQGFENLNRFIDVSLGLKDVNEKKSFWKKIFS